MRSRKVVDRKWLFLADLCGARRAAGCCCSCGCRPASCRPRTRAACSCSSACPPARRSARPTKSQQCDREIFPRAREGKNVDGDVHRRRRRRRRRRARTPAAASSRWSTGTSARARKTAPTRSSRRATAALRRACAMRRSSRSCRRAVRGLGQSTGFTMELQNTGGLTPRRIRGRARQAARSWRNDDPALSQVRLTDLPDVSRR